MRHHSGASSTVSQCHDKLEVYSFLVHFPFDEFAPPPLHPQRAFRAFIFVCAIHTVSCNDSHTTHSLRRSAFPSKTHLGVSYFSHSVSAVPFIELTTVRALCLQMHVGKEPECCHQCGSMLFVACKRILTNAMEKSAKKILIKFFGIVCVCVCVCMFASQRLLRSISVVYLRGIMIK